MMSLQSQLVLEQDDGSKFRCIILNVEAIWFTLYDSVTSRNGNVVYPDLRLMTSSKLELGLLICNC